MTTAQSLWVIFLGLIVVISAVTISQWTKNYSPYKYQIQPPPPKPDNPPKGQKKQGGPSCLFLQDIKQIEKRLSELEKQAKRNR